MTHSYLISPHFFCQDLILQVFEMQHVRNEITQNPQALSGEGWVKVYFKKAKSNGKIIKGNISDMLKLKLNHMLWH